MSVNTVKLTSGRQEYRLWNQLTCFRKETGQIVLIIKGNDVFADALLTTILYFMPIPCMHRISADLDMMLSVVSSEVLR
jgi:hypothetical protein